MQIDPLPLVTQALEIQRDTVERWHRQPIKNTESGLLGTICQQHEYNFRLWHEEDIARSPYVGDMRIAEVKRSIDKLNQQRNDWIEKIDSHLIQLMSETSIVNNPKARINTETPGSVFDRLSILSLRIFHLEEQLTRSEVDAAHLDKVQEKLSICKLQRRDLSGALVELLEEIFAGRKQLKVYRQLKMYNDPTLNPFLYRERKVG